MKIKGFNLYMKLGIFELCTCELSKKSIKNKILNWGNKTLHSHQPVQRRTSRIVYRLSESSNVHILIVQMYQINVYVIFVASEHCWCLRVRIGVWNQKRWWYEDILHLVPEISHHCESWTVVLTSEKPWIQVVDCETL